MMTVVLEYINKSLSFNFVGLNVTINLFKRIAKV